MGWARLDDGYAMHPKLVQAGLEATGLDARAISHCAKYETDGFVADAEVSMLAGDAKKGAALSKRLAAVNRWERDDDRGGYWVHDYLDYNKSHEQLEAERKSDRSRKNSGRNPGGKPPDSRRSPPGHKPESKPTTDGIPPDASSAPAVGAGGPTHALPPSRPVPDEYRSSSSLKLVGAGREEEDRIGQEAKTVARLVAEKRLATRLTKTDLEPITNRSAWLAKTADDVLASSQGNIPLLLTTMSVEAVVDLFEPPDRPAAAPPSPYPLAGQQPEPTYDEVLVDGEWKLVEHRVGA